MLSRRPARAPRRGRGLIRIEPGDARPQLAVLVAQLPVGLGQPFEPLPPAAAPSRAQHRATRTADTGERATVRSTKLVPYRTACNSVNRLTTIRAFPRPRGHEPQAEDRPHRRRRRGDAGHADRDPQARVPRAAGRRAARRRCPILNREDVDLMLLDVRLPGISGFEVLRIVKENYSLVEVIMISAINEIETAVQAMKHGAYHYITKDFDYDQLRSLVRNASERQDLNRQVLTLSAQVADQTEREFIVGPSKMTRDIVDLVHKIAKLSATVLILGESGTGKELLARLIHREAGDPRRAVHRREPRGDSARAGRERAVRPRARRVHRRAPPAARQVRAGVERHAVPRRDRRPAARSAGQAAARHSGGRDRARRRHQADQDRVPPDRRHQRRPREGGQGRTVPRGSLLPNQRHPDQAAAAARARPRTSRSSPSSSCGATTRASASRSRASPTRRWRC